jgi:large subunit ribosomal protein L20
MNRVKIKRNKHNRIFREVKNYMYSNTFKNAKQKFLKKLNNQFVSRKLNKRFFRRKWIKFINTNLKSIGLKYNLFMSCLKRQNIALNRKILYLILLKDILL